MAGGGVLGASAATTAFFGHMPDGSNTYRPDCPQGYWVSPLGAFAATRRITEGCRAAITDGFGLAPGQLRKARRRRRCRDCARHAAARHANRGPGIPLAASILSIQTASETAHASLCGASANAVHAAKQETVHEA